ncbi:MAG: hypothetical protein ACTSYA_13055 [Candidatus Kariarchaeaceae archaeon]
MTDKEIYYQDSPLDDKKSSSSVIKGLTVTIPVLISVMFGLNMIDAPTITESYMFYMLGLVIFGVMCWLTNSKLKMIFVGVPVYLIVIGAVAYLLPDITYNMFTPFAEHKGAIYDFTEALKEFSDNPSEVEDMESFLDFVFVIDLAIAFLVLMIGGFGLTLLMQAIRKSFSVMTVFAIIFGIFFTLFGILLLPYFWVAVTGSAEFALTYGSGMVYVAEGFSVRETDTVLSDSYFTKADDLFAKSDAQFQGLVDLGVFFLLGSAQADMKIYADNFVHLASATIDLTQGLVPFFNGLDVFMDGFEESMNAVSTETTALQLAFSDESETGLSQIDDAAFNAGMEKLSTSFGNFTIALDHFKEALNEFSEIEWDELKGAAGADEIEEQLNMAEDIIPIVNDVIDMFQVLINEYTYSNGSTSEHEVIIHVLYSSYALMSASDQIEGEQSSFEGTGDYWRMAANNLSVLDIALADPVFDPIETPADMDDTVKDFVLDFNGGIAFLSDVVGIGIDLAEFGAIASDGMDAFIVALDVFEGTNFTNINPVALTNATNAMDGVVASTNELVTLAISLEADFTAMSSTADAGGYGFFNDPAKEMATNFLEFEPVTNTQNLNYLASGLSSLFKGVIALQTVTTAVDEVMVAYADMEADLPDPINIGNAVAAALIIQDGVISINNSLENAKNNLTIAGYHLNSTAGNFSLITGDMVQLSSSAVNIANIVTDIGLITDGITKIQSDLTALNAETAVVDPADGSDIIIALDNLAFDLDASNGPPADPTSAMYDIDEAIADIDVQLNSITVES